MAGIGEWTSEQGLCCPSGEEPGRAPSPGPRLPACLLGHTDGMQTACCAAFSLYKKYFQIWMMGLKCIFSNFCMFLWFNLETKCMWKYSETIRWHSDNIKIKYAIWFGCLRIAFLTCILNICECWLGRVSFFTYKVSIILANTFCIFEGQIQWCRQKCFVNLTENQMLIITH